MPETTDAVGIVHGIDETYVVSWLDPDLAEIQNLHSKDIVCEFASANPGGFISADDVMDQARDIVADWDEEAL